MSFRDRKRITGKHPLECDACDGLGQTRHGETIMLPDPATGKLVTHKRGSGCLKCKGRGRLPQPQQEILQ